VNIVHGGVILVVYLFIVIGLYVFISGPFEDIIGDMEDLNMSASDSHIESSGSALRTVFDLMFAGMAVVPVVWFVYWAFSREPDWRYR